MKNVTSSRIQGFLFAFLLIVTAGLMTASSPVYAVTLEEEIELGRKIDTEVLKENPLSKDEAAQKEIDRLGQTLVKKGELTRPEIKYHFKVVQGDDLNAFAVPGGYIYFTERLWNVLRTDERAGVLAHEITHTDRRHGLDALLKMQRRTTILGAILILTGANKTIGDFVGIANQLYTLKYSRGDERQADEIGTDMLATAKLNPAGLLLAMRKIGRFSAESGGRVPTILSSHPDTEDRVRYLAERLTKMGVPVPPENIQTKSGEYKVGEVLTRSGDNIEFSSSQRLETGDIVWLMKKGWDFHYENLVPVPSARVIVTSARTNYTGRVYVIDSRSAQDIPRGTEVFAPPSPALQDSVATIQKGVLVPKPGYAPTKLDRLSGKNVVWDPKSEQLINDTTMYLVVTNTQNSSGYVAVSRSRYDYVPAEGTGLVRIKDPDAARWVGTVVSIGRGSKQVEVLPAATLSRSKTYEILQPMWSKSTPYSRRVVATAKLSRTEDKVVMSMISFTDGFDIADIDNGYDIYEQSQPTN